MKIIIMLSLMLALVPRGCAEENEKVTQEDSLDGSGYVPEDIATGKAVADWKKFIKESDSAVFAAKIALSKAVDRSEDGDLRHNLKFRNEIYNADGRLERLSEKLMRAEKYERKDSIALDSLTLQKMESFKKDFREDQAKLNAILAKLKTAGHK